MKLKTPENALKFTIIGLFIFGILDDRLLLVSIFLFCLYFPYKIYKVTHENKI